MTFPLADGIGIATKTPDVPGLIPLDYFGPVLRDAARNAWAEYRPQLKTFLDTVLGVVWQGDARPGGSPGRGRDYQKWATSRATLDPVPGPLSTVTRNGRRARTPRAESVRPSKVPPK